MKMVSTTALWVVIFSITAYAQTATDSNCGVNSSIALALANGITVSASTELQIRSSYPTDTVSMLDVKHMCQKLGLSVNGVKSTFDELLKSATPCIINLKNPDHFLVLLDSDAKTVRVIDGNDGSLEILPRSEIESRFTGYVLIAETAAIPSAPVLQMA